jgi:HSP20 family protein
MMQQFGNHPMARQLRAYLDNIVSQARGGPSNAAEEGFMSDADQTFSPPVDIFDHEQAWTVHVALPGAKKEDVGVNWVADKGELVIAGVVYRPGDEDFLAGLVNSERRVGFFERKIKLPPPTQSAEQEKEDVDADGITAKMQDGVLVVVVPKAEKDWTEVRKVDVE